MGKSKKFGIKSTYIDESNHMLTFYPEFISQLKKRMKNGPVNITFQQLPQPTPNSFSHRIIFDNNITEIKR